MVEKNLGIARALSPGDENYYARAMRAGALPGGGHRRRPPQSAGSATSEPCSSTASACPSPIGPQYGDLTCLALAKLLEREYQAFVPPPGYP